MIIPTSILLTDVSTYVEALYNKFTRTELVYHNLKHTQNVVKRSYQISAAYSLEDADLFILLVAAWFHDTGHLFGSFLDHESRSAIIMKKHLVRKVQDAKTIDAISECIMATKFYSTPNTLLEKILCDADTYNLGTEEFINTDKLVKKEFELRTKSSQTNWDKMTLDLLENHKYYTAYCQSLLNSGKQKNKEFIESRLQSNQ